MEYCASAQAQLEEDLTKIVVGYVEFIRLKVLKPLSQKNHCFKLYLAFYRFYNMKYQDQKD